MDVEKWKYTPPSPLAVFIPGYKRGHFKVQEVTSPNRSDTNLHSTTGQIVKKERRRWLDTE